MSEDLYVSLGLYYGGDAEALGQSENYDKIVNTLARLVLKALTEELKSPSTDQTAQAFLVAVGSDSIAKNVLRACRVIRQQGGPNWFVKTNSGATLDVKMAICLYRNRRELEEYCGRVGEITVSDPSDLTFGVELAWTVQR